MNKKMREIKAQIEVLKDEATKMFAAKDLDGAEKNLADIENLEREYKLAEKLFQNERSEVTEEVVSRAKTINKIKDFADNIKKIRNTMSVGSDQDGGYIVPEDILTDIEHLKEAKKSLKDLVSVENVTAMSGKRTYKKRYSLTGFSTVGEGNPIGQKATPKYDQIAYQIKKRAGIYPVTNELFDDSDANIYSELTEWIADESRVTDNNNILDVINEKVAKKLSGLDDIKYALNVTLGQAFKPTSVIVTNDDGLQYLDTLKDKDGKSLLSPSPADPMKLVLSAGTTTIPLEIFPNADIHSSDIYTKTSDTDIVSGKEYFTRTGSGTSESPYVFTLVAEPAKASIANYYEVTGYKIPMIIGDLKEAIRFFDRRQLNIMTSNTAVVGSGDGQINAFEDDMTLFRAIQRDDIKHRDDDAFVNGYIEVSTVASA